ILEVHPATLVLLVVPAVVARKGLLGFQAQAEAYDSLVSAFVKVIEVKDPYTRGHAERVATLSEAVAGELGHDYETRRLVRYAAVLHDVGKVGIPSAIINKPGALDDDEREIIKRHPVVGAEMLRDITFLNPALDIVRCHHERLDGRGYPFGVPGEQLSPLVRIVTAVDAFDAMTSTRSYRRALKVDEAIRELRRHVGTQFDGEAVEALAVIVARLEWKPTIAFASADELAELESRRRELDEVLYPPVAASAPEAVGGVGA
ncbi:MAG: HD-GYP domain-containing protein, partial [Actinobacteria bacterium]|nr:HD-GYP domain-containing protein [Actinomycetota bacterium]